MKYIDMLHETELGNEALFSFIESSGFLDAPAASTPAHHGCYAGGLVDHSIAVAERICVKGGDKLDVFVALVHDLCKAQLYIKLVTPEEKHGKTFLYRSDSSVASQGHGKLTLAIIDGCGIVLPDDAREAIEWHMGKWTKDATDSVENIDENQRILRSHIRSNKRLRAMCEADMFASRVLGK